MGVDESSIHPYIHSGRMVCVGEEEMLLMVMVVLVVMVMVVLVVILIMGVVIVNDRGEGKDWW